MAETDSSRYLAVHCMRAYMHCSDCRQAQGKVAVLVQANMHGGGGRFAELANGAFFLVPLPRSAYLACVKLR